MKDSNELKQVKAENKKASQTGQEKHTLSFRIQKYVEENSKKVMIISGSVIVAVVLFFVIKGFIEKRAEENKVQASVKISRVMPFYLEGNFQKALSGDPNKKIRNDKLIGLTDIINSYGGTKQAKYASIYAAQAYLAMNQINQAENYFKIALDSPSGVVLEGANAGIAVCKELKSDYKEAADYYGKASNIAVTQASKGKYLYFEALCREKLGEKDKAEKLLREIIAENKSDFVGPAKQSLIRLGTIIE